VSGEDAIERGAAFDNLDKQAVEALDQARAAVESATKVDPASVTKAESLLAGVKALVAEMDQSLCANVNPITAPALADTATEPTAAPIFGTNNPPSPPLIARWCANPMAVLVVVFGIALAVVAKALTSTAVEPSHELWDIPTIVIEVPLDQPLEVPLDQPFTQPLDLPDLEIDCLADGQD